MPVSAMRQTMDGQAEALARLLDDEAPVAAVAGRLRGRRVLAIGTGTSWHAASQAAWLLRAAGVDACAAQSADAARAGRCWPSRTPGPSGTPRRPRSAPGPGARRSSRSRRRGWRARTW